MASPEIDGYLKPCLPKAKQNEFAASVTVGVGNVAVIFIDEVQHIGMDWNIYLLNIT